MNAPKAYIVRYGGFALNQSILDRNYTIPARELTLYVKDEAGNFLSDIKITARKTSGTYPFYADSGTTDSSGKVILWVFNGGTITATPPSGSPYKPATISPSITADTTITMTLQQPISLEGYIYDEYGNPMENQTVTISLGGSGYNATTDSTGQYTFTDLPSGEVSFLEVNRNNPFSPPANNDGTLNAPKAYIVRYGGFALNQSILDRNYTIPARELTVHVQDPAGNSIDNVEIEALKTVNTYYPYFADSGVTNSDGDAVLWVFDGIKSLTATPPNEELYNVVTLNDVSVTSDETLIISLEYAHDSPVTTASLSPAPNQQGEYSDPVTVTLSATADTGYTIANTYYTVDGGSQQTYSTPFEVSGDGEHIITFWSVDNAGVPETPNSQTFTISSQPVEVEISSVADSNVRSGHDNRNYGASDFMRVRSSGKNRALVSFDQSEIAAAVGEGTVLSAKVVLTITDNGNNWGDGRTVDIHRLTSGWTEGNGTENDRGTGSGTTWNCATDSDISNQGKDCSDATEWEMGNSGPNPWNPTPTDSLTITSGLTGEVEYDVTSDVQAFLSGSESNFGWIIKKTEEGQNGRVEFGTKESSYTPQLVITYQP